jgi:hypothetical protein
MVIYAIYKQSGKTKENKEESRKQAARALKAANNVKKKFQDISKDYGIERLD